MSKRNMRKKTSGNLVYLLFSLVILIIIAFLIINKEYIRLSSNTSHTTTSIKNTTTTPEITSNKINSESSTTVKEDVTTNKNSNFNENEFFKDALFIGDSRMQGFQMHSGITDLGGTVYAHAGLCVDEIDSLKFINDNGTSKILKEGLQGKSFKKVFLMQGLNELGWPDANTFATKYLELVNTVKQCIPDTKVYIMSIIQVTKSKNDSNETYTKANVDKFNISIKEMCDANNISYLDINKSLVDNDGYLKADLSIDGVHLIKSGYQAWLAELINVLKNTN